MDELEAARPIVTNLGGRIVKTTGDGRVAGVSLRCRGGRMRNRNPGVVRPAQRKHARGQAYPLSHRRQSRRRLDRGRRHSWRRRQYRCTARGDLRSLGGMLFFLGRLTIMWSARLKSNFVDLGEKDLKNIARPVRVYALKSESESAISAPYPSRAERAGAAARFHRGPTLRQHVRATRNRSISSMA